MPGGSGSVPSRTQRAALVPMCRPRRASGPWGPPGVFGRRGACALRLALSALRLALCALRLAPCAFKSARRDRPACRIYSIFQFGNIVHFSTQDARRLRLAPCALRFAPCALRFAPCALRLAPCALRLALCALRFAPFALRLAFCALRLAPCPLRLQVSTTWPRGMQNLLDFTISQHSTL